MSILQKAADFIFAMDKIKSALYNASYTADIQLLYHLFIIGNTGESQNRAGVSGIIFIRTARIAVNFRK